MDYGIWKNFGLALPVKFRIQQSIIQNMHFTFKNPSFKKSIPDPPIHDKNMHSIFRNPQLKKKAFQIYKSITELDFQIQQSGNQ